jgi:multiple antibiotic resistance protein
MEKEEAEEAAQKQDISVTPLGIPLLGGPGAISTVMVLASQKPAPAGAVNVAIVVLAVGATIYISLRASELILRYLGITGINVMSRLLGLLLLAMAIQFLMDGFRDALPLIMGHGT